MAVIDVVVAICLLSGSALSLVAAIGMLRFRDVLSQMHLATKPQVLGVLLILLGVGLRLGVGLDLGMVILAALFQLATQPVAAHMVGRAAYRAGVLSQSDLVVDELSAIPVEPDPRRPGPGQADSRQPDSRQTGAEQAGAEQAGAKPGEE